MYDRMYTALQSKIQLLKRNEIGERPNDSADRKVASERRDAPRSAGPREKGKGAFRPRGNEGGALRPLLAPCPSRGRTRPARARRPVLPRTGSAVLWAMAGLAAEFGMGSGDPASVAALAQGAPCAFRQAPRGRPGGRIASFGRRPPLETARPGGSGDREARARAISTARLNASRRLQLRPIDLVVYEGPYRRENSSRRRLPA